MNETRDSIADVWGPRTPYSGAWPVRVDRRTVEEPDRWVQSACVLCSTGCGIDIGVKDGRMVGVRGRAADRVNHGRLGPKGLHGWEANASPDRLRKPLVKDGSGHREASWDEAMNAIVARTKDVVKTSTSAGIAFYSTGQLFIEEYYTLALVGKAGLGTIHMDGNTRLCTATASASLRESFGCDGQPASFSDIDLADTLFIAGHNPASQQTVLWMRILDRLEGPDPPKLIVVDPRTTATAAKADVHLAPRLGTNLPLFNGILHILINRGWIDENYVRAHTTGFEGLQQTVAGWTPKRVADLTQIPLAELMRAAEIIGTSKRLVSTVLQGVYQSMQATAAACQVNNIHLIRGMLGKPGCGVFQMNGQPTAQNTRETGADGEYPGFRNIQNAEDMEELARLWNVETKTIPHWSHPTHIMQIMKFCEEGSIKMLWIVATNPAVSLPDLPRIRKILGKRDLFIVVQDAFMTETAKFADVVLPAAIWGEKTGTYTNADRTVHISHKAIEPPGEARSDLDIFLDYAKRMNFRDKDGAPLIKWHDPQSAFEAWKRCSAGRLCDYTGLSYEKLTGGSGIQWPCNASAPDGTERLYEDGVFHSSFENAEEYGHDLITGAVVTPQKYKAFDPAGKAIIKPADYVAPLEEPDDEYPLWLTTGRVVYHFHTRTKTARAPQLNAAEPDAFVEMSQADAERYGIRDGQLAEVRSRRGKARARCRIAPIKNGTLFMPFHYGYFDETENSMRAANEITLAEWDPVSKQPFFKYAAVNVSPAER